MNLVMSKDRPCEACAVPFPATTGENRQPRRAEAADARIHMFATTTHQNDP